MHQMHDGSLESRVVNARDECGAFCRVAVGWVNRAFNTLDAVGWVNRAFNTLDAGGWVNRAFNSVTIVTTLAK